MQIQKGLVKYKDRSDIVCTYGITEDGRQYYFLDGNTIENGNIIASTVLVEAIDSVVPASSIGLIDSNGNVVIPLENKSIKLLSNNLLLVERVNPTTPSVLEAISLRSDPLAATKLVTTSAAIKEKMNARMGAEGRFVFNDQFSEATICDINGNNLVNGEYFSFIGVKGDSLFLSKNTAESEVSEVVLNVDNAVAEEQPSEEVSTVVETSTDSQDTSAVTETEPDKDQLDIQAAEVSQETIDNAMSLDNNDEKVLIKENAGFDMSEDITAKNFEIEGISQEEQPAVDSQAEPSEDAQQEGNDNADDDPVALALAAATESEDSVADDGEKTKVDSGAEEINDVNDAIDKALGEEEPVENQSVIMDETSGSDDKKDLEAAVQEETPVVEDTEVKVEEESFVPAEEKATKENVVSVEEAVEETGENDQPVSFDFGDNINYNVEETVVDNGDGELPLTSPIDTEGEVDSFGKYLLDMDLDTDIFADYKLHADTISMDDEYIGHSYKNSAPQKDTIIEDVAVTLSNLIKLNKGQRKTIIAYEEKIDQYTSAHKKVVEKARGQIREIENLKTKVKNYETIVTKLEAKNQVLESRVHDQDRIIATQASELETLRPQVEGKQELVKLLADAQNLLSQDGYSDATEDSYMKMMAA